MDAFHPLDCAHDQAEDLFMSAHSSGTLRGGKDRDRPDLLHDDRSVSERR